MKKIISIILLFFLGMTLTQAFTGTFKSEFIGSYHYVDSKGKFGDFEHFSLIGGLGNAVYCIEPGISMSHNAYIGLSDASNEELARHVGLSPATLEKISIYAYFGYGYKDHNNSQWIVATQAKIWQVLGRNFQFTSRNSEANPWANVIQTPSEIENKMNEIERLTNEYYAKPSIHNQKIKLSLGEDFTYQDDFFTSYQLKTNDPNVVVTGNKLTIKARNKGLHTVSFQKEENTYRAPFAVYHHDSAQDLFLTGNISSPSFEFSYDVIEGSVRLQKFDKDTKKCEPMGSASLNGAIYALYKENNEKIQEITITNCKAIIDHLSLGRYYLQEIKAPPGYLIDPEKHYFNITKDNISTTETITMFDQVKTSKLIINKKYLQENKIEINEKGALFEVRNKKNNLIVATLETDQNGNAEIILPYGEYYLVQIKGHNGYHFVPNKDISVNEQTKEEVKISLLNKPILKKIKLVKKDQNTKETIKLKDIEFKLYDVTNHKYICQNKDCIFKTDEEGVALINELYYSTYRLEEVKKSNDGYLWNKDPLTFIIDDDNKEITVLEFYNERVKGLIEIYKINEKKVPLKNIIFAIYAKEDILENGHLIYKKDELVANIKTNELGIALSEYLPLGHYYVKEISVLEGYTPNEKSYDLSLNYLDEETRIVIVPLEIINYKIPETFKNDYGIVLTQISLGLGVLLNEKKKYFSL